MKVMKLVPGLALAAVLGIPQNALSVVIGASDDTWVREDSPTSNRNGNDQVNARTDIDADDNDVILLRFPTDALITDALSVTLSLYWYRSDSSTANSLSLWGLNETDPQETTWSESVVTYNDAPGMIPDGLDPLTEDGLGHTPDDIRDLDTGNLTLLVDQQPYGPQVTDEIYSFSSAALTAFVNADSNGEVSFLITRGNMGTSGNQARFQVKEVGLGPILDVTLVPEPSIFALLSLGGLAFLIRRRS